MADNPYLAHRHPSERGVGPSKTMAAEKEPLFGFVPRLVKGDQVRSALQHELNPFTKQPHSAQYKKILEQRKKLPVYGQMDDFFKIVSSAHRTRAALDLSWFPDRARHAFGRRYADLYLITVQREPNYCDGWRDGIGEDHAVRCCSRGRVLRSLTKNAEFPNSLPILTFPTRRARWWHVLSLVEWRPCQLRSVWRTKWMVRA